MNLHIRMFENWRLKIENTISTINSLDGATLSFFLQYFGKNGEKKFNKLKFPMQILICYIALWKTRRLDTHINIWIRHAII